MDVAPALHDVDGVILPVAGANIHNLFSGSLTSIRKVEQV